MRRKKMVLEGELQYFYGMDRPTNVVFRGRLKKDGTTQDDSGYVEEILSRHVCTRKVGSTSEHQKVKITVEWE